MSASREIITIQAGNFSNFIGTHWWNMQESSFCYDPNSSLPLDINHDVLFKEGVNYKREVTYTPRLILVDLQDNLKSIRKECPLYRIPDEQNDPLWDGPVDVIKDPCVRRNPFLEATSSSTDKSQEGVFRQSVENVPLEYDFDSKITVWSDFLKTNLHPNSFCLLNETASEYKNPLEIYSSGDEIYKRIGDELIEEAIRKMSEECDCLQGFQLIYDSYNGFSGISNNILQHLDEEYNRRPSLCFPTFQDNKPLPYKNIKEQMHRLYAILLGFHGMNSYNTLFTPLSLSSDVVKQGEPFQQFPYIQYKEDILYQTSGILAAAIDTLTSQFRLKSAKFTLSDIVSGMSMYSRKLVCSSICLPFPLSEDAFLSCMIQRDVPEYYMTPLSPYYDPKSERTLFQSAVLRGVPKSKFSRPNRPMFNALEPEEVFGEYLNKYSSSSVSTATVFYEKCCVNFPFPNIFKNSVGVNGFLNSCYNNLEGVEKIPVAASFSNSDSAGKFLDSLLNEANKINFKEYVKCAENSYEKDDFVEVIQNLIGLRDNYHDY